jgi:hypothetical protein
LLSHHQWHFLIFQRMRKAFSRKSIWCCNMHQTAIRSFWIIFCSLVNGHQNDISLAAIPHFLWITIYNDVAMWGHSRHPSFAALSPHLAPAITVRKIMLYNCYPNIQWIWFYDILWSYPYQYHINIINNTRKPWPIMVHISLDQTLTVCVFMLHRCTVAPRLLSKCGLPCWVPDWRGANLTSKNARTSNIAQLCPTILCREGRVIRSWDFLAVDSRIPGSQVDDY